MNQRLFEMVPIKRIYSFLQGLCFINIGIGTDIYIIYTNIDIYIDVDSNNEILI